LEDSQPGCHGRKASSLSVASTGKMPVARDRQDAYLPFFMSREVIRTKNFAADAADFILDQAQSDRRAE
jgi:hypothetical protein